MGDSLDRRELLAAGAAAAFGLRLDPEIGTSPGLASARPREADSLEEAPRHSSDHDITAYGATGDGQSDDTAAVQASIEAAFEEGGGRVYVPAGRYLVGSSIYLRPRVHLRGAGPSSVLRSYAGESSEAVLVCRGVESVAVSDLRIDGLERETRGIWITDSSRVSVHRCEIVASGAADVVSLLVHVDLNADSCRISDNVLVSPHIAVLLQEGGGGAITDCIVRGNVITMLAPNFPANGTEAIKIDKRCIRTLVEGNIVSGSRLSAVTVEEGCVDTVVSSNIIHPAAAAGVRIEDGQGAITVDGLLVSGNVVRGGETGIFFGQEASARNVIVRGNMCSDQSGPAMLVWATDTLVQGNMCAGDLRVRGQRITVSGNRVSGGSLDTETLRNSQLSSNVIDGGRVVLRRATDVDVVGNLVRNTPASGGASVEVVGQDPPSSGIRLTGNSFERGSAPLVAVGAEASDVMISGNYPPSVPTHTSVHETARSVDDLDRRPRYSLQNLSVQRGLDARDAREEDLAQVLGTLIADLQSRGVLG